MIQTDTRIAETDAYLNEGYLHKLCPIYEADNPLKAPKTGPEQ